MSQTEKIIVITAIMECCMCPTTFTGRTADGCTVYARYRWGILSVRVDPRDPAPHGGAGGVWILEKQLDPEGLAGAMYFDELKILTAEIIEWPDELTPLTFDEDEGNASSDYLLF
jgi:hypothetical protein